MAMFYLKNKIITFILKRQFKFGYSLKNLEFGIKFKKLEKSLKQSDI